MAGVRHSMCGGVHFSINLGPFVTLVVLCFHHVVTFSLHCAKYILVNTPLMTRLNKQVEHSLLTSDVG